jgi:hypothetical protein
MIIPLINMNTSLRKYPLEGRVTASPSPDFFIVSDLNRCSRTKSMQTDDRSEDPL